MSRLHACMCIETLLRWRSPNIQMIPYAGCFKSVMTFKLPNFTSRDRSGQAAAVVRHTGRVVRRERFQKANAAVKKRFATCVAESVRCAFSVLAKASNRTRGLPAVKHGNTMSYSKVVESGWWVPVWACTRRGWVAEAVEAVSKLLETCSRNVS